MDEIKRLLQNIQKDINETKESIKSTETLLSQKIDEKFNNMQIKMNQIEGTVDLQEKRLDVLEKQIRQRNIVLFGVEEKEHNYEELCDNILTIFKMYLKIDCSALEIESLKRIGRKGDKIRPVIITISTLRRKIEILRKKQLLAQTKLYIKEDYPPKILEKRKQLNDKLREEREKGNRAFLKYDKLVVYPQKETISKNFEQRNKRNLSVTPPFKQNRSSVKKNTLPSYWWKKNNQDTSSNEKNLTPDRSSNQYLISEDE